MPLPVVVAGGLAGGLGGLAGTAALAARVAPLAGHLSRLTAAGARVFAPAARAVAPAARAVSPGAQTLTRAERARRAALATGAFAGGSAVLGRLTTPSRPIGTLPSEARVPSQYPAGVPTGVGGGNAGASRSSGTAPQLRPPAPQLRPPAPRPRPGDWAPAAQQNPRLPAGRNVAIVNPRSQAQNRALDQAAQNAGLPAWNWKAAENEAVFRAAQSAGEAAEAARQAQVGRGYLSAAPALGTGVEAGSRGDYETPDPSLSFSTDGAGGVTPLRTRSTLSSGLPAVLDQSKAEYWQRADMQAWANASEGNRKLAERAMARAGYSPQPAVQGAMPAQMTTEDAILRAQAAGALDGLRPGATSGDAILAGQAAGVFDGAQAAPAATPMAAPGRMTTEDAILRAQGMGALDGLRPGATSDDAILAGQAAGAFDAWGNPADEQRRRAAALSNSHVRAIQSRGYQEAIQQHGMGLG
jgi:hypothetical protein